VHLLFALSLLACDAGPDPVSPEEVELTEEGLPNVPVNVEAPPENAKQTSTGIPYRVLKEGTGDEKPTADARVEVHYAGWTTDGEMFDSSYSRKRPATFPLQGVIAGWTEGLQEMVVGERRIFWIPEEKAYKGAPGKPEGMLVFDIELLKVMNPPQLEESQYTAPADAEKLESGVAMKTTQEGEGTENPKPDAKVKANFTGWTSEGKFLQSSTEMARVPEFRLTQVPPGWSDALQNMVAGEKARAWIPEALTKVEGPRQPPSQGDIVVDFELVEIIQSQPAPDNVSAPPADAKKLESGLAYKVLEKGSGTEKPTDANQVAVNYTGWTTDGLMFDSSLDRGQPTTLGVRQVIPGWTEALKMMVVGDKWRVWIPEDLAYKGRPGSPQGMLVFDVELLDIMDAPAPRRLQTGTPGGDK